MTDKVEGSAMRDQGMTRRTALASMGSFSLLATLDLVPTQVDRALSAMEALAEIPASIAEEQPAPYTPKFFTQSEWRLVRMLSDYVIPRDAKSGSATEARVPEYMDFLLSDREASESSKMSMRGGLGWMNREARDRFGVTFMAATDSQRRAILDDIAWPARARPDMSQGVAFFTRFRDLTASGFFSSQMGWKDLQFLGNVSLPAWNGCPPEAMEKLGVSQDLMTTRIPIIR
jgi:gluconate 2-dehydrogenase gamma chain